MTLHTGQPVAMMGVPLTEAKAVVILLHGRGATADDILPLALELDVEGVTYLAPQAVNNQWYPQRFMMPLESNEPWLSSALGVVNGLVQYVEEQGIPSEKIVIGGFSQGACLTLEYAARHARRYGGIVALTGGLIGPDGTERNYPGDFAGTPIFIGCSDVDFHIPLPRVKESTVVLQGMNAVVTERIYPGMGHTVNQDEIEHLNQLLHTIIEN